MIRTASKSLAQDRENEDRIKVRKLDTTTLSAILADGAGGIGGGARAAELVVNTLSLHFPKDFGSLFDQILDLDRELKLDPRAGISTLASVYFDDNRFFGAVIGDSDALLIQKGALENLTPDKEVKPLLGDGEAFPTMFTGILDNSILILCSDGLSKYISVTNVLSICVRSNDPVTIVDDLVSAVELADGKLQDDVSVIVLMD